MNAPHSRGAELTLRASSTVQAGPTERVGRGEAAGSVESTGHPLLFLAYLLLVFVEYGGLANQFPILKTVRVATVLSYAVFVAILPSVRSFQLHGSRQVQLAIAFVVFTVLSVAWADVQMNAFDSIRPLVDYTIFMTLTATLVDRPERATALAAVLSATAVLLVAENLDSLGSASRTGQLTAPYFMGDGNDFAWGLNVIAPLSLILLVGQRRVLFWPLGLVGFGSCVMGIVGTQSRGGTLGLGAAVLYAWFFVAKRKVASAVAMSCLVAGVVYLSPSGYVGRMSTVADYEADNSAQARLQAWEAAISMAVDYPLGVGAGNFNSAYGRRYRPEIGEGRVGWGAARWISPHSIYFKVLGEYGFLGLGLLLWLLVRNLRDNRTTGAAAVSAPVPCVWHRMPSLVNMSLVAFAVGGIFLGGFSYPHLFLLTGLTVALKRLGGALEPDVGCAPKRESFPGGENGVGVQATGSKAPAVRRDGRLAP